MVGEVFAGISGLKLVMDTLKGFKDINDATVRNSVAMDLQAKILAAYQTQLAMTQQVSDLEKEVAQFKNWDAEKQRYELKDIGQSCVAYALKAGVQPPEPEHYLCANCYAQSKKRFLQKEHRSVGRLDVYVCNDCGVELYVRGSRHAESNETRRR
jgi:hypothetical protein